MAKSGKIVESTAPAPLEVMAVRADDRLIITVNNHTADAVSAPLTVLDFPFAGPITRTVRTIDDINSCDGNGLHAGVTAEISSADSLTFSVKVRPYATIQITLGQKISMKE